ncbi:hypothetical protein [Shouchella clausii]|jgi:hypothetical protein|nr:hypothetical protein [Shouchella clausii]SPU21663.1 Uncharacterised protein [Niallia circulans]MCY1103377.1 hypothetical protein [Shouchella clausii]MEB5472811.1 hypothetical protein [Shouchella clausii]MEB5480017.1 hypothetical protein [Shouchella clausii]MED4158631.1 hypothetical protein [Shouchella clausii]
MDKTWKEKREGFTIQGYDSVEFAPREYIKLLPKETEEKDDF